MASFSLILLVTSGRFLSSLKFPVNDKSFKLFLQFKLTGPLPPPPPPAPLLSLFSPRATSAQSLGRSLPLAISFVCALVPAGPLLFGPALSPQPFLRFTFQVDLSCSMYFLPLFGHLDKRYGWLSRPGPKSFCPIGLCRHGLSARFILLFQALLFLSV